MKRPETFNQNIRGLFEAMSTGGEFSLEDIPHFDGGLFSDGDAVPLEAGELRVLAEAGQLDWSSVEPAIFGTLFERSLDPSQRARLGAHYTSKEDILTIVEPVLMTPLRKEWQVVQAMAGAEADKARVQSGQRAVNTLRRAERDLANFAEQLRRVRVLDPACGSGNFLYVSLKELLDLDKEVYTFAGEIGLTQFFPGVNPEQLHGIESSPYAHELAQVAIWIGYLQWMIGNGFGSPAEPILGPMTNIVEMDAILAYDENGNSIEPDWPEADVIVGNPPFLGIRKMREELDSIYVDDLRERYAGRLPGSVDLVCYWYEKARAQIKAGKAKRAGLLATNSIRGGANRTVLKRIKETGDIFFAESDRPWILEGAAVRVSMVGFDDGMEQVRTLDGIPTEAVNADLTSTSADFSQARRLIENAGLSFIGTTQAGPFEIKESMAKSKLRVPSNPNGRSNSDVVKRSINGLDITRRPRHVWTVDFGPDMSIEEAALFEEPFEYVRQYVKPFRDQVRRKRRREKWWLFAETAPGMRKALGSLSRYIATPWVSKHRIFVWMPTSTIPALIVVFARQDDYFFGVLHSRAHELWAFRMGTWMGAGNDLRYTARSCFETFPLPYSPGKEPVDDPHVEAIAQAALELDRLRLNWLNPEGASEAELKKRTLTNLYNQRPTWLENAHTRLDEAVFAAYGWPSNLSDEEVLQNLLALNLERS